MSIPLVVPKLGESISEAVVSKWLKQVGEPIAVDEPVVDLETDKVTVALPSPVAGVLTEQLFAEGAAVKVGETIGSIAPGEGKAKAAAAPTAAAKAAPASAPQASATLAPTPTAKRESGAPTHEVQNGSAPHRTLPPSVRKAIREGHAPAETASPPVAAATPMVARAAGEREEVVPMSPLRKRIAERLVAAQHTAAILTTFNECDMSQVMALRARYQETFSAKHKIKLGFMSFFVRASVEALKDFPGVNAEVRGTDIIYKKHYDFGIAVGSGRGLVVPVLRNVDQLGFAEIELGIGKLAEKAKTNQLTLDDLTGGTFSITNGGIYGSMMSTPLLNMPQSGILGLHNIVKRPMAVGDEIKIRPMMYLALSYDHRVVDGREAVSFLVGVKERIENPERLMLAL